MSEFSIPTDDIDILDFASSHSQSPVMLPSPQGPESIDSFMASEPNEKAIASSAVALEYTAKQYPSVEPGIAIDSFLGLLDALDLPGLELVDGVYHLRGSVSEESFKKLSDYARRVTEITLNDGHSSIDPGTWVRLVQLGARYNKSETLFPSLTSLHVDINNADTPLSLLPLSLVPTLKSLEVINFPETCLDTFLTFLVTLTDEAPGLSSLTLGKSILYSAAYHSACVRFVNLRKLALSNVGQNLELTTLLELGQLPELESLVLDAPGASHIPQTPCSESVLESGPTFGGFGSISFGEASDAQVFSLFGQPQAGYGYIPVDGPSSLPLSRAPSPSPSNQTVDEAEIPRPSNQSTCIVEPEEPNTPAFCKLTTCHIVAKVDLMNILVDLISAPDLTDISLTFIQYPVEPTQKPAANRPAMKSKGRKAPIKVARRAFEPSYPATTTTHNSDVKHFQNILQKVLASWSHSLIKIGIHRREVFLGEPYYELDLPIFQTILSCTQTLRRLEISGWTMASDLGDALQYLTTLGKPSELETLHLPIDIGAKGISLNRLRGIVESCPYLTSFQCGFKHLSNVPPCPEDGAVFRLKTLRGGNPVAHNDHRRLMSIAQYLDALFPNLEVIETQEGCNAEQWKEINELVKMCQFSRSHHRQHTKV